MIYNAFKIYKIKIINRNRILNFIPIFFIPLIGGLHFNKLPNSFSRDIMYSLQSLTDTPFPVVGGLFGILNIGNLLTGSCGFVTALITAAFGLLSSKNKKNIQF